MRIRSNIRAGDQGSSLRQCQKERDYWKGQALRMEEIANSPAPVQPTTPPSNTVASTSCGFVNGVYFPDKSGTCG
jgi:hypothetical protein